MVNKLLIASAAFFILNSCCDAYLNTDSALRSKNQYKKYLHAKANPNEVQISTHSFYEALNLKYEEQTGKTVSFEKPGASKLFLKFHSTGTYYQYKINDSLDKILTVQEMTPEKGNFNFLIKKNYEYFFMEYSSINCGAFSKNEFKVINDTLLISSGSNKGYRVWYYFMRRPLPKEYKEKEPDI